MPDKLKSLEKAVYRITRWLNWVAAISLVAMLTLTIADVIGNKVFKLPVPGSIEIVSLLGVIVIAFSIAQTQVLRGHIEVEFLVTRLPKAWQKIISCFIYLCGMLLFGLLTWRSYDYGRDMQASGEVSMTQQIPLYPLIYGIAFCCIWVFLVLLVQMLEMLRKS